MSGFNVPEIEKALIAALLVDWSASPLVAERIAPEDIEGVSFRAAYEGMLMLQAGGFKQTDLPSLIAWLQVERKDCCDNPKGWRDWVLVLAGEGTHAAYAGNYAKTIAKAAVARKLAGEVARLKSDLETSSPTFHEGHEAMLDESLGRITKLVDDARSQELVRAIGSEPLEMFDSQVHLETGLKDLDETIYGLHKRDNVVIGAYTSQGKSTLALQIAMNVARVGGRVLFFSLEMGRDQLFKRMISNMTGIPLFGKGSPNIGEQDGIDTAVAEASRWKFWIPDRYDFTVSAIEKVARSQKRKCGVDLVVVDYIQLVNEPKATKLGRAVEVGAVSRAMKKLAVDLDCTMLSVAQLNRGAAQDDEPGLHHLRESGAIEADADVVLLLSSKQDEPGTMRCRVAKNRHGETKRLGLYWNRGAYAVRDLERKGWTVNV